MTDTTALQALADKVEAVIYYCRVIFTPGLSWRIVENGVWLKPPKRNFLTYAEHRALIAGGRE